jgi:hypothetical protein
LQQAVDSYVVRANGGEEQPRKLIGMVVEIGVKDKEASTNVHDL